MKILVAEDDLTSRSIVTAVLRKWGFDPVATKDGTAAWEVMQQTDAPRLLLLDWNMPGMDGLEVCRRLRERPSLNPPYVILLTGRGEKNDIVKGLETGANDYILKPYDNQELQARIGVGKRMLELQESLTNARDALEHLAMHDGLTGVFNRRAIVERLSAEVSRAARENRVLSVGLFDIDHFKRVNDTWGHQVGDEILAGFARRIQDQLRGYDCLGRYGGEEFLVIAPGTQDTGDSVFERLRAKVAERPFSTRAGEVAITVSLGVATTGTAGSVDLLLAAADNALYKAKAQGRNRVVFAE